MNYYHAGAALGKTSTICIGIIKVKYIELVLIMSFISLCNRRGFKVSNISREQIVITEFTVQSSS